MSGPSTSSEPDIKEYVVRVPKLSKKKYHMMRFSLDRGQDFFKSWSHCKIEKENNAREMKDDEIPKFGAGSEFGRELREEARRKRFGINLRKYKQEDQPWVLSVGAKSNKKKYKGVREGGIGDHTGWYVFMQGKDGAFEAYPVEEWYNFQPVNRYKSLNAEEAEKEFEKRDTIMNYFQVMLDKKMKKDADPDEEESKKKGSGRKKLLLSEMDDWDDIDDDEDEERDDDDDDDDAPKKKKLKRKGSKKRTAKGGKKKMLADGESDDSCMEESDDYDEGAEHDYISSDSSDSDQENMEKVIKDLAGVEEADGLKKLLNSDEEDEEEEKEGEKSDNEDKEDKEGKKKKKPEINSDDSSDTSDDEIRKIIDKENETVVNKLKRKVKENPHGMPDAKKMKLSAGAAGSSSSATVATHNPVSEDSIRRYLLRKPMTTTDLLQKFKSKKSSLDSNQLVQQIASALKRVNPAKQQIKGKMYLYIKT